MMMMTMIMMRVCVCVCVCVCERERERADGYEVDRWNKDANLAASFTNTAVRL